MAVVMLLLLLFTGVLQCSANVLSIRVDKDGADTVECLEGKKSCLTVNYVLTKLQDIDKGTSSVEILVSNSEQKLPCDEIYFFNYFSSLTITGVGDVTFRGYFCVMFGPALRDANRYVQIKGIKFENNCRPAKPPPNGINHDPGLLFVFTETLIFEDCIVRNGSTVFWQVKNLTIDNCIFSEFSSTTLPVIANWMMVPDSRFSNNIWKSLTTKQTPKLGSIVVRNSVIANNSGTFAPVDGFPGPGYMWSDVTSPPSGQYVEITHYYILIENCTFTNNSFTGRTTPLLFSDYADVDSGFSADFNLVNSNFENNSITPKAGKHDVDVFPLLSLSRNENTSFSFTVSECSFINNSFPPSFVLGNDNSVNIELNVLDSVFQSSGFPQGLQVVVDLEGKSKNNVTTNISGNKFV